MNSGRAKKIAKAFYGDLSRRGAKYFMVPGTGQVIREELRRRYQAAKATYNTVVITVKRKKTRVPKWYDKRNQGMKKMHQKELWESWKINQRTWKKKLDKLNLL